MRCNVSMCIRSVGTRDKSCKLLFGKNTTNPAVERQERQERDGPTTAQMCLAIIHDTTNKNETCMRPGGTITRFCVMNLFPSYVHVYTEYYDPLIVICWSCCCGIQLQREYVLAAGSAPRHLLNFSFELRIFRTDFILSANDGKEHPLTHINHIIRPIYSESGGIVKALWKIMAK